MLLLKMKDVYVHYDTAEILRGINIEVEEGEAVGIIGANGAGKSTLLRAIAGLVPIANGQIWFRNQLINGLPPHEIVKYGITFVPEGHGLFPHMSVMANLKLGAFLRKGEDIAIQSDLERIFKIFPKLKERSHQKAGTLSGGEQAMLAIARALMSKPKLLLLDEPTLGLSPLVIEELIKTIKEINANGISILLVEQNADLVINVTKRGYVLEVGEVVLEGDIKELIANKSVQKAFFGG